MPTKDRVYWDSNVFISAIQQDPERGIILNEITNRAENGELEIVTSAYTLCEVARLDDTPLPEEQEKRIVDFFENPYIILQQLDMEVAARTRAIVRQFSMKPKDAVHLASAVEAGVPVVHSYDKDHMLPQDGKIGSPPLRIREPTSQDGQTAMRLGEAAT